MSQENVEIVQRAYEAFAQRDDASAFDLYAADIEWDLSRAGAYGVGGVYRGHDGVRQSFRELLAAFSIMDFTAELITDAGDYVMATVHEHYLGRTSAVDVDRRHYAVWTLRDGKITRMCAYLDPAEALEAAGLQKQALPRENVEIVRRLYDSVGRRDTRTVRALYDPEIEMVFSRSPFADFMDHGHLHGLEAVEIAFRDWYDAWEDIQTDVGELIDAGEQVISVFTYRGRGRVSRVAVEWKDMAGVWALRRGKVVRVDWLRTREEALEAVGLRE